MQENVWGCCKMTMTWQQPKKRNCIYEREYFKKMGLPQTLTDVGIDKEYFDIMAQKAADGCKGSFVPLSKEDIVSIYEAAL